MKNEVRLLAIGDRDRLPRSVRKVLDQTIEMTKDNAKITVTLALSYSGRHDIVKMVRGIAKKVREGSCQPEIPDPDLLIRTSGEMRISNFFLWQIPYTELYVTPTLWPDFRQQQYIQALIEFQRRQRRFGKTDEQAN
jgi:undecaprenyl diphosphate synthase